MRALKDGLDRDSTDTLAAPLRIAMHLGFLLLPTVGALRAITASDTPQALAITTAVVLVTVYALGAERAMRRPSRRADGTLDLQLPAGGWVTAVTVVWMGTTIISAAFVWVAFPLFFLVLFALPRVTRVIALAIVAIWAILTPLLAHEQWALGIGEIMGPMVGAVFSLIAHAVYRRLLRESDRNRRLLAQLREAQQDLADSERRKGVVEERQRLAQDLHDTLAQGLNSIVMQSRAAAAVHPGAATELDGIENTARENLAEARRIVRDLADRAGESTLEQSLRTVIAAAERQPGAPGLELRVDGSARELEPAQIETLHRGAQSLVANVLRHARAERCVLTLAWWEDRVSLDVADDGIGFDPATVTTRAASGNGPERVDGGDGLRLLRRRLASADGTVSIDSAPGEGTTVGLVLPLEPAAGPETTAPAEPRAPAEPQAAVEPRAAAVPEEAP